MKSLLPIAVLTLVLASGCDSTVSGITFKSGFGVSAEQAYEEGYSSGKWACALGRRGTAKYKSDTPAHAAWMRGYYTALRDCD